MSILKHLAKSNNFAICDYVYIIKLDTSQLIKNITSIPEYI